MCLLRRCLAMDVSIRSPIVAFSRHITFLPPYGCSSRVIYMRIAITSSLSRRACDVCDRPTEWHLQVVLVYIPLLPISTAFSFHSSCVVSGTVVPSRFLLTTACLEPHYPFVGAPPSMPKSSSQAPTLSAGQAFSSHLYERQWNPSM